MTTSPSFRTILQRTASAFLCATLVSSCGSQTSVSSTDEVTATTETSADDGPLEEPPTLEAHFKELSCQPDGELVMMGEGFRAPSPLPAARDVAERFLLDEIAQVQPWIGLEVGPEIASPAASPGGPGEGASDRRVIALLGPSGATDGLVDLVEYTDGWHLNIAAACFGRDKS